MLVNNAGMAGAGPLVNGDPDRLEDIIALNVLAVTRVESTARFGMELGYHVTLLIDATAACSPDSMRAALEVNGPRFAHAIVTTAQLLDSPGGVV